MLSFFGPILGDGIAGYFIDPDNHASSFFYKDGTAFEDSYPQSTVQDPYSLIKSNPKVAVLIDENTVSSGEAVALAFVGRPNTRLFGSNSCGKTTANHAFTLSDGAVLALTFGVMTDRNKNKFWGPIIRDETPSSQSDAVTAAINWLNN